MCIEESAVKDIFVNNAECPDEKMSKKTAKENSNPFQSCKVRNIDSERYPNNYWLYPGFEIVELRKCIFQNNQKNNDIEFIRVLCMVEK